MTNCQVLSERSVEVIPGASLEQRNHHGKSLIVVLRPEILQYVVRLISIAQQLETAKKEFRNDPSMEPLQCVRRSLEKRFQIQISTESSVKGEWSSGILHREAIRISHHMRFACTSRTN